MYSFYKESEVAHVIHWLLKAKSFWSHLYITNNLFNMATIFFLNSTPGDDNGL